MIEITKTEVVGWEHAIRGMRNPLNSWDKSDTKFIYVVVGNEIDTNAEILQPDIGDNDLNLMKKLANAGSDHSKFLRMITVYCDINAPLYWWKEYDTYKVGTVANSCSTMHKITSKPIELDDFSIDDFNGTDELGVDLKDMFLNVVADCESLRKAYLRTSDKRYWKGLIELLPESYMQKRTVMLNYAVLKNMYHSRKNHKLDEWHTFCEWIESLPYSELITGDTNE